MSRDQAPDWYLREWADHLGKRQADLVKDRGWLKSKASKFFTGEQPYRREIVNELAEWLGIQPFELLMSPAEAEALRELRNMAAQIVAATPAKPPQPPQPSGVAEKSPTRHKRTGTTG